jgi:hypothetical protein
MSQADSPNTTSPSRRTVLAGISVAAAPLAAAVEKSLGGVALTDDPIFALIKAYDRAASQEMASYGERDGLEETLPKEQRTWSIHFGGGGDGRWPPEGCTDAPEWINAQLAIGIASEKISDQMFALLTTAPRTIEGVIALLERLDAATFPEEQVHDGAESLISTMGEWYDGRVADAADSFHSTLAAAAPSSSRLTSATSRSAPRVFGLLFADRRPTRRASAPWLRSAVARSPARSPPYRTGSRPPASPMVPCSAAKELVRAAS